jgi:hypothetical protein
VIAELPRYVEFADSRGLFAAVLGNRRLLWPLVAAGVASVLWWSGGLLVYVVVQWA